MIVITVFSDGHLQKALSPSLLDCLIDEVYLILQNITEKEKTKTPPCFMHTGIQKNTDNPNSTFGIADFTFAEDQN